MGMFSRCADIVEIIIRDLTGKKMEHIKFNGSDKKNHTRTGTRLFSKYGIDLTPDKEKDANEVKGWLNSDNSFI